MRDEQSRARRPETAVRLCRTAVRDESAAIPERRCAAAFVACRSRALTGGAALGPCFEQRHQ